MPAESRRLKEIRSASSERFGLFKTRSEDILPQHLQILPIRAGRETALSHSLSHSQSCARTFDARRLQTFTLGAYEGMLRVLLDSGYVFRGFHESETERHARGTDRGAPDPADSPYVLMRHDIDMCLKRARRMAEIEATVGIAATYFFMVRTEHYNVFSADGTDEIKRILGLGHHLGLHFDCAAYADIDAADGFAAHCRREVEMLQTWFGAPVRIVSFHRPSRLVLEGPAEISAPLEHTYLPRFTQQMHYCSDSQGRWRYGTPLEQPAFQERRPMHILTHPIWWNRDTCSSQETLETFLNERHHALGESLAANCRAFDHGAYQNVPYHGEHKHSRAG